jgi:hypothetical protein
MTRQPRVFNVRIAGPPPYARIEHHILVFLPPMTTGDRDALRKRLEDLRAEHRDLDDVIARVVEQAPFDQLRVQRLKKRKLLLRDQIQKLESELLPDIIA